MSTMKKPSEYPPVQFVDGHGEFENQPGETLWHRAFFAAMTGKSIFGARSEEIVVWSARIADASMAEIERREKGEEW